MAKKIDPATHGPSWAEIILGIVLSLGLGIVLGIGVLVARPIQTVKELPKEPDPKAVYQVEGTRDAAKARQAPAKRAAFAKGQTVTVNEDELNTLASAPAAPPPPTKAGEAPPPPPAAGALAPGAPNFRIRDGEMQVAVPVTISAIGQKVTVMARGNSFVKQGDKFVFVPNQLYVGSCPVERIPFLSGYVRDKLLAPQPVPEDIAAAWPKLTNVTIEGNLLTLAMQ
jgi:hypothetical protein